jgi:hypothetical protein
VLIGHLNKNTSSKDLYRSLGSIDVMAAARSVLQVSCSEDKQGIKVLKQVKSSLAPKGKDICFRLDAEQGIVWFYNEENNSENGQKMHNEQYTKQELTPKPYGWTVDLDLPSIDTVRETINMLKSYAN